MENSTMAQSKPAVAQQTKLFAGVDDFIGEVAPMAFGNRLTADSAASPPATAPGATMEARMTAMNFRVWQVCAAMHARPAVLVR